MHTRYSFFVWGAVCGKLSAAAILLLLTAVPLMAADKPAVPDLTQGGEPDKTHDWTLGATGARGWIWGWKGQTSDARQIFVTKVDATSPADGKLRKGDVITGVDGKPFDDDARVLFAKALTRAEAAPDGALRLLRWRDGRVEPIVLNLAVMGAYSATAPYDCPKSARIFDQGCRVIAARGLQGVSIPHDLNALALLASGRKEYGALVADYAHVVADHQPGGHVCWGYAYATVFLAEYVLATRDASVMDGLRRLSLDIARGQGAVGTWGHAFARPDGTLNGYGAMNQPGIVLTTAMALARLAGVRDPDLDRALGKSVRFLRWYVDKGAIPYGDHEPWPWHDDNGKCSSAAVMFDLLGDGDSVRFFSRMGAAAYDEREGGHTGNFFAMLWAMPGVSRCGPRATAAYFHEQAWYYDLARGWDGGFVYQGTPGNWGGHQYGGWDSTGAYLLAYALPLKSLYITGRKPCSAPPLTTAETDEVIAAGRDFTFWTEKTCYEGRSTAELLAGLSSWSPAVRKRSAQALGVRDGDVLSRVLALLGGADRYGRYGACEALGLLGARADAAAARLRALLSDPDPWIKCLASDALVRLGPAARSGSVPALLSAAVRKDPADPRLRVQGHIGEALFSPGPGRHEPKSILSDSLDGVAREPLYAAMRALLNNEDGRIRGLLGGAYKKLTDADIAVLLPAIGAAVRTPAPSGTMFADGIRLAGLDVLSRLHIREGMAMCVDLMEPERWGANRRVPQCVAYLKRYGGNAKGELERLRDVRRKIIEKDRKDREKNPNAVAVEKLIASIEADANPPRLMGAAEFIREGK